MNMLRLTIYLFLVSCILVFNVSCSRTVTPIVAYGDQLVVTITLAGNMDLINNRYFLVLGSAASLKVPLPAPNVDYNAPEMIEPGMTPTLGSVEVYYNSFYSTWSSYVLLDPGGYFLTKGPFVINQTTTREPVATIDELNKTLTFSFRLDRAFTTVPNLVYFDLVTVDWPSNSAKIPADHLTSTNAYISKVSGSVITITDGLDSGLDPSLDIVTCKAEIQ